MDYSFSKHQHLMQAAAASLASISNMDAQQFENKYVRKNMSNKVTAEINDNMKKNNDP